MRKIKAFPQHGGPMATSRMARNASIILHGPEEPAGIPELTDRYAPVEALQHF